MNEPLWAVSACQAVQLLKSRQVTPLQLIDVAEARIKETEPAINATPITCYDRARERARALMANPVAAPPPGFLYGLPILIKDATAVKGVRFTRGSLVHKDDIADFNDPLVEVLESRGAIIIGKTNIPEFSAEGADPDRPQLRGLSGPMARSVSDLALFLDAMAAKHPRDLLSRVPPVVPFSQAIQPGATPLPRRIAWSATLGGLSPVEPEVARICGQAAAWFSSLAELTDAWPDMHDASQLFQVARAEKAHVAYTQRFTAFMEDFDLLCCPCVMLAPFDVAVRWVPEVEGTLFDNYVEWLRNTYALSLLDVPSMSLPCGQTKDGRPVGLQLVGKRYGEAALLAAAAAYERAHDWAALVPLRAMS
eukprot:jgi/Astpho2/514/Aster-x0932